MIKAYLDSYNQIVLYVSKKYYDGEIASMDLLTDYGPQNLENLQLEEKGKESNKYTLEFDANSIKLGNEYYLIDNHGFKTLLEYRYIVKSEKFEKETYTNEYLGYEYSYDSTKFSLWAPISSDVILVVDNMEYHKMDKNNSVFSCEVKGNLDDKEYYYLVKNNGVYNKVLDPYSYSYNIDQTASVVVDLNRVIKSEEIINPKKSKVIYEVNVRDFSSSKNIKHKNKFLGLVEEESLTYLDNLGIEYLQLMPINYFNGDVLNNSNYYNWGYNPNMFGVPHPNYVYNIDRPVEVINECKQMINKVHQKGIKVTLDVVFNHVENREDNNLNLIVPNYYYLIKEGKYSNGSYCGIDLDSKALMVKRLIKDMCKRWIKLYGVDGFRFDLMGILNYQTINELYEELKVIKKDVFLYGEGWDMPSLMENEEKAMLLNASKMRNIAFFNDQYRENLKYDYISEDVIKGNYLTNNNVVFEYDQSINYIECHDNHTYYDFQKYVELREENFALKRQLFKNIVILLSNGYAFYHSGQEFFRTKKGVSNSYNSLDDVNTFDWNRLYEYDSEVNIIEKMIRIREKYRLFNLEYTYENIDDVITLESEEIQVILNLSNKDIKLKKTGILVATAADKLEKYDLVIYKKRGV